LTGAVQPTHCSARGVGPPKDKYEHDAPTTIPPPVDALLPTNDVRVKPTYDDCSMYSPPPAPGKARLLTNETMSKLIAVLSLIYIAPPLQPWPTAALLRNTTLVNVKGVDE
jgi:hypothetical protein